MSFFSSIRNLRQFLPPRNQVLAFKLKIYIDGVAQALGFSGTIPSTIQDSSADINIGKVGGTVDNFWDGKLDDVRVYYRTLTDDQVTKLYESGYVNP